VILVQSVTATSYALTLDGWIDYNTTFTSSPSLVLEKDVHQIHIFGRSIDGSLLYAKTNDTHLPVLWKDLAGVISSDPASVYDSAGELLVFVRGSDNRTLWYISVNNSSVNNSSVNNSSISGTWKSLDGELDSSPAAVATNQGIFVFVRGLSDELWYRQLVGKHWTEWKYLGGQFESEPYAITHHNNSITVLAQGIDGNLWTLLYNGTTWGNWTNRMIDLPSSPTAVNANEEILIFARGTDGSTWFSNLKEDNATTTSWRSLGGVITYRPIPLLLNDNKVILYVVGTDGILYHKKLNPTQYDQ
jgi:hypothetical protein